MTLRPIGPRVFVRPLWPAELPDTLIAAPEIAKNPPTCGTVIAVGQAVCPDCDGPLATELQPGMVVYWASGTVVDDFEVDGENLWDLRLRDVLAWADMDEHIETRA